MSRICGCASKYPITCWRKNHPESYGSSAECDCICHHTDNLPVRVTENVLRGPAPVTAADWRFLKKIGVTAVINLETGIWEKLRPGDLPEAQVCDLLGIEYRWIRCSNFRAPTLEQLLTIVVTVSSLSAGGLVYVHCRHGKDRTGQGIAFYRVFYQGWPVAEALKEMLEHGFHLFPYKYLGWIGSFKRNCRRVSEHRSANNLHVR